MKITRGIAVALTAAILASGGGTATALMTAQPAEAASTQPEINSAVQQILNETNAERAKVGLAPLLLAPSMNAVAQKWTENMAANHTMVHNPYYQFELPQPWQRVGENVGQGYTTSTIVPAWMASEGHRANILGTFTHIGIGYYVDETGRGWFTQNFGYYDVPQLTEINEPTNMPDKFGFYSFWAAKPEENVADYKVDLYTADGNYLSSKVVKSPSVSFTGLSDMTTYMVQVTSRAVDVPGLTYTSPVKTYMVTTLEDLPTVTAPTNITFVPGETDVEVNWNAPAASNGTLLPYTVDIYSAEGVLEASAQTTDPHYIFRGLTSNTAYTVNVTATTGIRANIASATSTADTRTLLSSVAEAKEVNSVSVTSNSPNTISANWQPPVDYVGFDLKYLVTLSAAGQPDVVVQTTSNAYTFGGLKHNTPYTVKVQANVTAENGINQSTSAGVVTNVTTQLDYNAVAVTAPSLHPVEIHPRYAVLSWDAPASLDGNLLGYTITVQQAGQPDRVMNVINSTNNFYVVTDLLENTAYTFSVKANAASANGVNLASATSESITATTPYAPDTVIVSAPTNVTATAPAYNQVDVKWAAPTTVVGSITGYKVTLTDGNNVSTTKIVQTTDVSFTGLNDYTDYTVDVVALATSADMTNNASSDSASASVKTPAHVEAPNAPTGLEATNVSYDKATLTWTAPTGVYGTVKDYTVTLKQSGQPDRVFTATDTNYEITGLSELSAYTVQVSANAVAKDGVLTATSPFTSVELTTPISPSTVKVTAPTDLAFSEVAYNSLKASWTAPTNTVGNLRGYEVTVKDGATVVARTYVSSTDAVIPNLSASKTYTVQVAALATSPDGTNNMVSPAVIGTVETPAHVEADVAPAEVKVVTATDTVAVLSWTAPAVYGTVKDYTITLKQAGQPDRIFGSVLGTSFEMTGLTEHTSYTAEIVANVVSSNGELTATSPVASVDVNTTWAADAVMVDAVTDVKVTDSTSDSLNVTWVAPAQVVGTLTNYKVTVRSGGVIKASYMTTSTALNVEQLSSNTDYTVEVQAEAVSANGLMTATSEVASVNATTAKSALVSVEAPVTTVSNVDKTSATVAWTTPAVTGTISGYRLTLLDGETVVKFWDVSADTNSYDLTGLNESAVYTVRVVASAVAEDGVTTAVAGSVAGTNFTTLATVVPPVVVPPVVVPPVVVPVEPVTPVEPPVVVTPVEPVTPAITAPVVGTPTEEVPVEETQVAPLADTGVNTATTVFGVAGILALLAGFGFIFLGRNRPGRQH